MRKTYGVRDLLKDTGRNYILKRPSRFTLVYPFWSFDPNAPVDNVFRLLPAKNREGDGEKAGLTPYRLSPEPHDYGIWLYGGYVASIGGKSGITFLIGNNLTHDEYELRRAPYNVLYENVVRLVTSGAMPHWRDYNLIRLPGRVTKRLSWNNADPQEPSMPLLLRPEVYYFAFALVASHPSYPFTGKLYGLEPDQKLFVVVMRRSVGEKLMDLLDSMGAKGEQVIDWDPGLFVHITPPTSQDAFGYDVSVSHSLGVLRPSLRGHEQGIIDRLAWWEDILEFPTAEEQIKYICQSQLPAEVIYRCLQMEFGSYLPDEIVSRAKEQINYMRGVKQRVVSDIEPAPKVAPPATFKPPKLAQTPLEPFVQTTPDIEIPGDILQNLSIQNITPTTFPRVSGEDSTEQEDESKE